MNLRSVLWEVRVVAGAVLLTLTAGCYSMQRVPARLITTEKPTQVVVRDADGAIFAITEPTIVADSLVGNQDGERVAMNLREVDAMVVRKYDKGKTFGFAAGMTGLAGMVLTGAMLAGSSKDCNRLANRNNQCANTVTDCKYSCTAGGDPQP
ncbi:MAG: hypothetical protein EXR93_11625 [Gemmatimonadetes bacterium]|nr:hypothetical protein [Gemmatimonadota bacterium]